MTNIGKKINQTEFNKWGEKLIEQVEIVTNNSRETPQEKEKTRKVISLFSNHIRLKNTFALLFTVGRMDEKVKQYSSSFRNEKWSFPCENGELKEMTHEEWYLYLFQRVESHHKIRVGKEVRDEDLESLKKKDEKDFILK